MKVFDEKLILLIEVIHLFIYPITSFFVILDIECFEMI